MVVGTALSSQRRKQSYSRHVLSMASEVLELIPNRPIPEAEIAKVAVAAARAYLAGKLRYEQSPYYESLTQLVEQWLRRREQSRA